MTAEVVAKAVGTAVPGSEPIIAALAKAVLQCQDEATRRLSSIESKVDLLLDGPWNTGRRLLEEASVPGRTRAQQSESLSDAATKFREAIDLQVSIPAKTTIQVELATVFYLLGDNELAAHYAGRAYHWALMGEAMWSMPMDKGYDARRLDYRPVAQQLMGAAEIILDATGHDQSEYFLY